MTQVDDHCDKSDNHGPLRQGGESPDGNLKGQPAWGLKGIKEVQQKSEDKEPYRTKQELLPLHAEKSIITDREAEKDPQLTRSVQAVEKSPGAEHHSSCAVQRDHYEGEIRLIGGSAKND